MCYNAEVSLGTFTFVALGAAYMWRRNAPLDRALAALFMVIALMQLVEYFLWRNLECGPANKFWTRMVPVALMLQPLLSLLIVWQFNAGWAPYYKELFFLTLAILIVLGWYYSSAIRDGSTEIAECTTLDEHGHLAWPKSIFTASPTAYWVYWIGCSYAYATLKSVPLSIALISLQSISHQTIEAYYPKSWPSIWCHFVNALVLLGIARPFKIT